ncbi:aldo/keto reductase [Gilvimarinus sp. SDUM040013]|uniref:Aldo/keto reductase n=1 Tax=Gilvimarinus gilvus TaxID=3058038 RepID=A0ABU4S260_9GAMM|nr:aldo/keto reductase [Gilvimarinus sp. SDUM040013]MDO3384942.1 aldo/keto reductase [Gilvimarinus sp. SDUM040013]MDX6851262.1 aldo/keto reductase [Gilvimarinus sp. SDUM040013]
MVNRNLILGQQVGNTGVVVPPYALGAAPLGNLYQAVADDVAEATLRAALGAGLNYIDTAPHYGFGLSESRVGHFLQGLGAETVGAPLVSTKVGRVLEPIAPSERADVRFGFADTPDLKPVFDYSYSGVMRSFEESCRRLGRENIDIVFAHDLGELTHGDQHKVHWQNFCSGGMHAIQALKAEGRIKAFGLGVNEVEVCQRALVELDVDLFLLAGRYTLLEQTPLQTLFPACQRRGVAVVAAGPFNSGILAGTLDYGQIYYNYAPAPDDVVRHARAIKAVCDEYAVPLPAAALQFPLAHPQVVSVLAGFASAEQVNSAKRWVNTDIPQEFWRQLRNTGLIDPSAPTPTE